MTKCKFKMGDKVKAVNNASSYNKGQPYLIIRKIEEDNEIEASRGSNKRIYWFKSIDNVDIDGGEFEQDLELVESVALNTQFIVGHSYRLRTDITFPNYATTFLSETKKAYWADNQVHKCIRLMDVDVYQTVRFEGIISQDYSYYPVDFIDITELESVTKQNGEVKTMELKEIDNSILVEAKEEAFSELLNAQKNFAKGEYLRLYKMADDLKKQHDELDKKYDEIMMTLNLFDAPARKKSK